MEQKLVFTNLVGPAVDELVADSGARDIFVLADTNTEEHVLPQLAQESRYVAGAKRIVIPAGEQNKNIETLTSVWQSLSEAGASRTSLVINVGGGVVTDLGGFAASTFKRGMKVVNIPTTVLGAVDAAVGGKTGINFNGYKNQLGTFAEPLAVVISTIYFNTLDRREILSGYAEMIKHGLLKSRQTLSKLLNFNPVYPVFDSKAMMPLLGESVLVKKEVVDSDPTEKGLRKTLNFGHTIGHALESYALNHLKPIAHGYAVAWGMVAELVLSHLKLGFPSAVLHQTADFVYQNYGAFAITCDDYPELLEAMSQDKKNSSPDAINFSLLRDIGIAEINQVVSPEDIKAALDIYRDLMRLP